MRAPQSPISLTGVPSLMLVHRFLETRVSIACLLVLCCGVGLACTPATDQSTVVGTYVLSIETDTLHLDAGGRYRRVFGRSGAPRAAAIDTGRWRMSTDGRSVALAALPQRWPAHGRYDPVSGVWHQADTLRRGFVSLRIRAGWRGDVTLEAVPELGWLYRRLVPVQ